MIEVEIKNLKEKVIITMKGHSKHSKKGENIVCAGISGTLQFLVIHLFNNLKRKGKFNLSSGEAFIEINIQENDKTIIDSFIEYLKLIEKSYPGTLSIRNTS